MRSIPYHGGTAKVGLSFGTMVDIPAIYSDRIVKLCDASGCSVPMGDGVFVFTPVIGDALINCIEQTKSVSGPVLVISEHMVDDLAGSKIIIQPIDGKTRVNWLFSEHPIIKGVLNKLGIPNIDGSEYGRLLNEYCCNDKLKENWMINARRMIKYGVKHNSR